jgi:hypothetical protein
MLNLDSYGPAQITAKDLDWLRQHDHYVLLNYISNLYPGPPPDIPGSLSDPPDPRPEYQKRLHDVSTGLLRESKFNDRMWLNKTGNATALEIRDQLQKSTQYLATHPQGGQEFVEHPGLTPLTVLEHAELDYQVDKLRLDGEERQRTIDEWNRVMGDRREAQGLPRELLNPAAPGSPSANEYPAEERRPAPDERPGKFSRNNQLFGRHR